MIPNEYDIAYNTLVSHILEYGVEKSNRTGVNTIGVFGYQMRFDLRGGQIPMLTTKKMHTRSIIHEILWYLQGADNIKYLKDNGVTIWDEWADANGNLGPVYGYQWRRWPTFYKAENDQIEPYYLNGMPIDQIAMVVDKLRNNPTDRRIIVSAWNVADLNRMALPPCHYTFQFYAQPLTEVKRLQAFSAYYNHSDLFTDTLNSSDPDSTISNILDKINFPKYQLSLLLNQRSCDVGLGVPFNIVQYSILMRMFCEVANMVPGEFIWSGADVHIYVNHIEQLKEQITRVSYSPPTLSFARKVDNIDDFRYDDFIIEGYQSHPTIKMEVAV